MFPLLPALILEVEKQNAAMLVMIDETCDSFEKVLSQ